MRRIEEYEREGVCADCGDGRIVYVDSERCDGCDSQYVHCEVCNEEQHEESKCRHVFRDECFQWAGSGASWSELEPIKKSFLRLVGLMPTSFPLDLFRAIRAGEFRTFTMMPLIGGGGRIELYGITNRSWENRHWRRYPNPKYGEAMVEIGEGEHAEECADGWRWLQSLCEADTAWGNSITLQWLPLAMGRLPEPPKGKP